jgi:flagellar basal-body rod modification protein FlgD
VAIDPTTGTGASTGAPTTTDKTKKDPLGRDAFMNLLLTQLQHQDPTSPQPDGEFLAQLAQFSSLEQLQTANGTLSQIATFFTALQPTTAPATPGTTPTEGK